MVELGRIDITCKVSMMSSQMALPRSGHLDKLFHMFAYLKCCHKSEVVFDTSDRVIDMEQFISYSEFLLYMLTPQLFHNILTKEINTLVEE